MEFAQHKNYFLSREKVMNNVSTTWKWNFHRASWEGKMWLRKEMIRFLWVIFPCLLGLDDKTCQAMLKGLPNLRCVDLSWSACITDSTVEVMLNVCPQLRLVAIVGLKLITTKALLPIIPRYNEWYESRGINPDCMNGSSGKEGVSFPYYCCPVIQTLP